MKQNASQDRAKKKLALLMNIIAPYRLPIYSALAERFDMLILHGGAEANRSWSLEVPTHLKTKTVWTLQLPMKKRTGVPGTMDTSYVHINLGLLWALPRFRPDVIVSNEMGLRTIVAIVYGRLARIPVWVWWGGTLHTERYVPGLKRRLRDSIASRVDQWISYGNTSTEYLESLGVGRERVLQIQNCVNQETFLKAPEGASAWFDDAVRPVLLSVGQLIERKGHDKLIEACGRLRDRGREFTLVIVGKGPERSRLIKLAKRNGVEQLLILPNQSQEMLNRLYRSANVFVFPTIEDVWGLVVNEAMWAGASVLCSKYAGCAREIVPEENIFDPIDEESFDAALERVFDNSIRPSDPSKLWTWQRASESLYQAISTRSIDV